MTTIITKEIVEKTAKDARLQFNEQESCEIQKALSNTFNWLESIKEVDVSNVEPMHNVLCEIKNMNHESYTQIQKIYSKIQNQNEYPTNIRQDIVNETNRDEILLNTPDKKYGYIAVPKVIQK